MAFKQLEMLSAVLVPSRSAYAFFGICGTLNIDPRLVSTE